MTAQACTIVTVSYLAQARVLARSFLSAQPGGDVVVLVTDDPDGLLVEDASEPFRVVRPDWLDLDPSEFLVMAGIYDATELSTSLKPWLMRRLLETTGRPLLYLDSDIEVFAPLDDLLELATGHGIAVSPHLLVPLPRDGRRPTAAHILASGVYNGGFLAAGPSALDSGFFEFWCEQLARDGVSDQPNMLFYDQRWLDFIECFDHAVIRDPTVNLAYWSAWAYALSLDGDRVLVDGRPLRSFHFSGFDPKKPHLLSVHQDRIDLADVPALARLCRNWAAALEDAGQGTSELVPYRWGRSGGLELDHAARRLYREGVIAAESAGRRLPPSPFDGDEFGDWLAEVSAARPDPSGARLRQEIEAREAAESRLAAAEAHISEINATKLFRYTRQLRRIYGSTRSRARRAAEP